MIHSIVRRQSIQHGVFYGIISSLSFAMMSVFVKQLGEQLPTAQLIFFRFVTSLMILIPWVVFSKDFTFKVHQPVRYIVRILAALLALFFVFYAIKFIPLVDALLLNNTAPLFVPFIAWAMTGSKTPRKAFFGIVLGFIGVGVVLNPGKEILSLSFAACLALAAGFLSALAVVQMRLISKNSSTQQMLFYYFFVSTLISGGIAFIQWVAPGNMETWLRLLAIGIFGTLYQVFATLSYVTAPVRLMTSLMFLTVVFGGFFDWLIWGHIPSLFNIVGITLVIIGAIITIYFGQKEIALIKK